MKIQIVICSGIGSLSRKIIWFNGLTGVKGMAKQISHVAIRVFIGYFTAHLLRLPNEGWYIIESTTFNKWAGKSGFQVNQSLEWFENYRGRIWTRELEFKRTYYQQITGDFINENTGKPYESGILGYWELLLCGLRLHKLPSLSQLHCSETNVLFVQKHNVFSQIPLANNFPPHTFWEGGSFEDSLLDCEIGKCVKIK